MFKSFISILLLSLSFTIVNAQIVLKGQVFENGGEEPIPFVNITALPSGEGTTTDIDGNFVFRTDKKVNTLNFSFIGYETLKYKVTENTDSIKIILFSSDIKIDETVIIAKRRKIKKDTAAITLYRNVVKYKDQNKPKSLDSYHYKEHTKMEFDLYKYKDKLKKQFYIKPFRYAFEFEDSTESGNKILPSLLQEDLIEVYYNKKPAKNKTIRLASLATGLENTSANILISDYLERVDMYDNVILVAGKSFISPFAPSGLLTYRYFLSDSTVNEEGVKLYRLDFSPRNKHSISFNGYAWIEDVSFAITEMEFKIPKKANLNFVNEFYVNQKFSKPNGKDWFLVAEEMHVAINPLKTKKGQSLLLKKRVSRNDIDLNINFPDSVFKGETIITHDSLDSRSIEWWKENRVTPLTETEENIFVVVDSITNTRTYRDLQRIIYFGTSGYLRFGKKVPIEIGQIYKFFSWNRIEGRRLKFGFRTNRFLSRDYQLTAYGAYGLKDKQWKGLANLKIMLPSENNHWHTLEFSYVNDFTFLGATNNEQRFNHDNIFLSLLRTTPLEKIMRIEDYKITYEKEWLNGFSTALYASRKTFFQIDKVFEFNRIDKLGNKVSIPSFSTMEIGLTTKLELGKNYFKNDYNRISTVSDYPEVVFDYSLGIEDALGGEYTFHKFKFQYKHKWDNILGVTKYRIRAGYILGEVPYPLLFMHQGNNNLYYSGSAYSNMGEFEYASDRYGALWLDHHFEGKILNSIPLIKELKFRSIFLFKILAGDIKQSNKDIILIENELTSTFEEKEKVYIEMGFGIENILKALRVDFMWRMTQPKKKFEGKGIQKFAVKFAIQPKF